MNSDLERLPPRDTGNIRARGSVAAEGAGPHFPLSAIGSRAAFPRSTCYSFSLLFVLESAEVDAQLRHDVRAGILDELNPLLVLVQDLDVDAQALELFDEHFEGLGHARLHD